MAPVSSIRNSRCSIWQAHQHSKVEQIPQIDLANGSQDILVTRTGAPEVGVSLPGPGDAAFLAALTQHASFGYATLTIAVIRSHTTIRALARMAPSPFAERRSERRADGVCNATSSR